MKAAVPQTPTLPRAIRPGVRPYAVTAATSSSRAVMRAESNTFAMRGRSVNSCAAKVSVRDHPIERKTYLRAALSASILAIQTKRTGAKTPLPLSRDLKIA